MPDRPALASLVPAARPRGRRLAWGLGILLAVLCTVPGLTVATAGATGLTGWLGDGAQFPSRSLVLVPPAATTVNSSTIHVTENGAAVSGLTVTPTAQAGPGDFGLMVVADQSSSMKGAALDAVVAATKNLVGLRQAQQQFGVIGFAGRPRVLAPLSADSAGLTQALAAIRAAGSGADVPAAIRLALDNLARARVALGAIVVVSDGVGRLAGGAVTPTAISNAAAAARIPIFVVGLQDKATTAPALAALHSAAPGQFVQAPPSRLTGVMAAIDRAVTRAYVARWRSAAHAGQPVRVTASLAGVTGAVTASYQAPRGHASASPRAAATSAPASSSAADSHPAQLVTTGHLSPTPAFDLAGATTAAAPPAAPAPATPSSFWSSGPGQVAVAGLVGLMVALAVWLALYRPSRRGVRVRVGSFVQMDAGDAEDPLASDVPSESVVHRLENSDRWQEFSLNVEIARSPHTPIYLVKRAILIAMVMAALATVVGGSTLLGFVPLIGWWFVLKSLMKRGADKQREKFRQALPGYLQDLASAIRVGRSLVGALTVVAESADEPTKSELERAVTDEALGRPLDLSLEAVAKRMEASDLDQVAMIAALNRRSGSNVAEALDRVAEGARERQDLKREVKALTAQAKMSSWVLTALPGLLLVGLAFLSPMYAHPLFHTTMGNAALAVGAGMVFGGWKALKKITDVRV